MNRKNLSHCFDLVALGAILVMFAATGCAAPHRDHSDRRDRDFSTISAPSGQPDRRSDNQKQKPQQMPKPTKQRTR
jgi:hypothetical protein